MRKKSVYIVLVISIFFLIGCSSEGAYNEVDTKEVSETAKDIVQEVADQTANIVDSQKEHVLMVKNGHPESYPETTYQEAFESFFSYPTWKYFTGTKEGPDEDGDGVADYTEENVDIVEFTGYCMYQETEVKALIQFTVDKEAGTFTATYLSFNEVPQSTLMLYSLLEKAFEVAEDIGTAESTTESQESDGAIISKSSKAFPILFRGYEDSECPVMVHDEEAAELKQGTYDEMLASCVNDGITMYAPPVFSEQTGTIYTATRWDAYPDQWTEGLLTYDEFIAEVNFIAGIGEEKTTQNIGEDYLYKEIIHDEGQIAVEDISGSYVGLITDKCCLNIYSSIEDVAVGNFEWENGGKTYRGEIIPVETNIYKVSTAEGNEILFGVYKENGNICLDLYLDKSQKDYLIMQEHYQS